MGLRGREPLPNSNFQPKLVFQCFSIETSVILISCSKYIHTVVKEIKELVKKVGQATVNVKSCLTFCNSIKISLEIMYFSLVYDL